MSSTAIRTTQANRAMRTKRHTGRMLGALAAATLAAVAATPANAYYIPDVPPPVLERAVPTRPALEWKSFEVEKPEGARPMQSR